MAVRRQIIAFGGGGFSMESSPALDDYVLAAAREPSPRVCFLPTASADSPEYVVRFYRTFSERDCVLYDATVVGNLERQPESDGELAEFLAAMDVIYVGGGNTVNMLALWRAHGIDRALRAAWQGGTVLAGLSAGMICWFECSVTDSFGPLAELRDGLGLLAGSACPHYDSEEERRPVYHALVANGFPGGYAADDGVALHFVDDGLHAVVSSRPNASAYRVELVAGQVAETALTTRYLGDQ
jgi:dipeptidase E